MELVLLTFGLLFAICRLGVRNAVDHAGSYGVARYGDMETFRERHGDKLMNDAIELMIRDEVIFDEVWDKIERSIEEYDTELNKAPPREKMVWEKLLTGGRRPLAAYNPDFRASRGFKQVSSSYDDGSLTMIDGVNHSRAMHCLMWLQGKETESQLQTAHTRVVKPGYEGEDNLADFDESEWNY